jgi:hypothetical protein
MSYFSPSIQEGSTKEKTETNGCLKCMLKKFTCPGPGKLVNAQGASPRRYGAPVAIMFSYLDGNFR